MRERARERERERAHDQRAGAEGEGEADSLLNRKPMPSMPMPMWGSIPGLQDHDLNQRQTLNHLNPPGGPQPKFLSYRFFLLNQDYSASPAGNFNDSFSLQLRPELFAGKNQTKTKTPNEYTYSSKQFWPQL